MKIFGLMMVRNEADIVAVNLLHHFSAGIDCFLVVDNGSSDDTSQILERFARDGRVKWTRNEGAYRQAEITTELAREACSQGADWVIPIDADEFWCAPEGSLKRVLSESSDAALEVQVTNFVQHREQKPATAAGLLSLTRRAPIAIGRPEEVRGLVEENKYAFVEVTFPAKWISRATKSIRIDMGNHEVSGVGEPVKSTDEIVCLHAPLRSESVLEARALDHGKRAEDLDLDESGWWQARRWGRIAQQGMLQKEWAANSYADGALDVYGEQHPVVFDPRLRDLVRPWVEEEAGGDRRSDRSKIARVLLAPVEAIAEKLPDSVDDLQAQLRSALQERQDLLRTIQLQLSAVQSERERAVKKLLDDLTVRDRMLVDLGDELHSKVGERDETIRSLQQELDEKGMAANNAIHALKAEIAEKVGERDKTIRSLQQELQEKVAAANQTIQTRRTEMEQRVEEANRLMCEAVGERDRTIDSLTEQIERLRRESQRTLDDLRAERDSKINALDSELAQIKGSKTWRLLSFYLKIRRKLLQPFR